MARTRQRARRRVIPITTWTRFYLPRDQEWPTWPVAHDDVHVGPLAGAGLEEVYYMSLGRMVEDPEQAAYIIVWPSREILDDFLSSPACAEFLRNLPETKDNSAVQQDSSTTTIESARSAISSMTLEDGEAKASFSSSSSSPPAPSRFLTLEHTEGYPTADLHNCGRLTITAFSVPQKSDYSQMWTWYKSIREIFNIFLPRCSESIQWPLAFSWQYMTVWFWVANEDGWVERTFGKMGEEGRTVICEFRLWPKKNGFTTELEDAAAKDPVARASWDQAVAKVMPPVTAWKQERWDVRKVPRFLPDEEMEEEEESEE